jgi:hypothetical protein
MARVLGEYPKLDRWRRWKISETAGYYVLEARGFWQRVLIVLEKNHLRVLRAAEGHRFSKQWIGMPESERRILFGSEAAEPN